MIITCFNYEEFVEDAIRSVIEQNCNALEIIVVDDGSTDRSWSKINGFESAVTAVRTENRGALRSALTGLTHARGEFVYFLDADDLLCPGSIAIVWPHLKPGVSKVQFRLLPVDRLGKPIGAAFPALRASDDSQTMIHSILLRGYYATPPTSGNIYRKSVYENLGDLSYERAIDGVTYLLAPFVGDVVSIDRALAKYRIHGTNLSQFADVSSKRLVGYADRFMERLRHLKRIVGARALWASDFHVKRDYSYTNEMKIMGTVAEGRRPGLALLKAYCHSVLEEHSGRRRVMMLAFGFALFMLPARSSRRLIALRLDQSRRWRIRKVMKRLLVGQPFQSI